MKGSAGATGQKWNVCSAVQRKGRGCTFSRISEAALLSLSKKSARLFSTPAASALRYLPTLNTFAEGSWASQGRRFWGVCGNYMAVKTHPCFLARPGEKELNLPRDEGLSSTRQADHDKNDLRVGVLRRHDIPPVDHLRKGRTLLPRRLFHPQVVIRAILWISGLGIQGLGIGAWIGITFFPPVPRQQSEPTSKLEWLFSAIQGRGSRIFGEQRGLGKGLPLGWLDLLLLRRA